MQGMSYVEFPKEVAEKLWGKKMAAKVEADLRRYHPKISNVFLEAIRSYGDPLIDFKTRIMIIEACVACLGLPQMRMYMLAALNNGITEEQLWEILRLVGLYAGEPTAVNSSVILCQVLERWYEKQASE